MKEKVAGLIDKLQELKKGDAALSELSHYTKLLYAELMCAKSESDKNQSTKKVSVIMPGYDPEKDCDCRQNGATVQSQPQQIVQPADADSFVSPPSQSVTAQAVVEKVAVAAEAAPSAQPTLWETEPVREAAPAQPKPEPQAPTPQKKAGRELNDLIAEQRPSLNDRLKNQREEVASRLGNAPVKNLHQAIGLNEKFGFINDLFRGDQSLYERSIKTINESKDLEEALYWINRELKIKLGWQDNNKTVQQFYGLIRKRFS